MEHVDRVAHIERLAQPERHCGARVQAEAIPLVLRSDRRHGIGWRVGPRGNFGDHPSIRPSELKPAVWPALELVALFVDRAMVPATEEREIREGGGPPLGPVMDVVPLAEAGATAREATAAIPVVERSTDRRR